MEYLNERIEMALAAMKPGGPRDLRAYLGQPGPDFARSSPPEVETMIDLLLAGDPNSPARLRFSNLLRSWDNAKDAKWAADTARNTAGRRHRIHELLRCDSELGTRIDELLPFYSLDEPLIIALEHHDWYAPREGVRDYYWSEYVRYLREKREWDEVSLLNLDNSTRAIVECLSNPESPEAYASRGLVMGYVQSGKTANFTGVAARAADAGYRLIVVLAGTWNILRNQTQRRFDKELLGKELLQNDETYTQQPPGDWPDFLEHGADPTQLGHYTWQRLTRPDIDFRRLRAAIDNLEFEKANRSLPIYDSSNLHGLPVKLLVVKKHPGILANLVKDLNLIRTRLADLPTLVIDDESDQAGLNTVDPRGTAAGRKMRSRTNERIVELLRLFPRGQYVGYTATPYANALVDPDDPEDLFPRDFIVSLDRPKSYMGVSDFFDPDTDYSDLQKDDFSLPEIAYIRRVGDPVGADDEDLKKALRSYVLAGAIKLYRRATNPQRYKAEYFRHHTMLVHTSSLRGEQHSIAARLKQLWDQCAFNSPTGLNELAELWKGNFARVSAAMGEEIVPESFEDLIPHLSEAIKRIELGQQAFLVVNSDTPDAPDFSAAPVWKVIVGGNKLSRGYTIEGLTVSFYRRVAGTADTLMQMGRWFGFRPGHQDLVRVFLGVKEGRQSDIDLVSLFKEVCRMEELFREELKRYVRRPGAQRITPREIPPLISVTGNLPPTASNKMFNARLVSKNFGGRRSQLTLAPAEPESIQQNLDTTAALLGSSKRLGTTILGGTLKDDETLEFTAVLYEATNKNLVDFLGDFRWLETRYKSHERPADTGLQIEFLEKHQHDIESWLVVAPQRKVSFGDPLRLREVEDILAVKERHRTGGRGFQVFGEPPHRTVCEYISDIKPGKSELTQPNPKTAALRNPHRGVLLLYPVREQKQDRITIGYELFFPENNLPFDLNFTVRRKDEGAQIAVQNAPGSKT